MDSPRPATTSGVVAAAGARTKGNDVREERSERGTPRPATTSDAVAAATGISLQQRRTERRPRRASGRNEGHRRRPGRASGPATAEETNEDLSLEPSRSSRARHPLSAIADSHIDRHRRATRAAYNVVLSLTRCLSS